MTGPSTSRPCRILTIDGGGIRGIIPGRVLVALEEKLQARNGAQARIADYFDFVAGTSTGGILACGLLAPTARGGRPRFTAEQVVALYVSRGGEIFDRSLLHIIRTIGGLRDEKYASSGIESVLAEAFEALSLADLLKPCLVPAYDIEARCARFFRQHRAHEEGRNFLLTDVARATSAAPTYFEAAKADPIGGGTAWPVVDGGVFANNPALCAYADVRHHFRHRAQDMVMLSLGTGSAKRTLPHDDAKDWGLLEWVRPLIDVMMSGVSETVHYQLLQMFDAADNADGYLRLQADLAGCDDSAEDMDNASPENIDQLVNIGDALARENDSALDLLVDKLTHLHPETTA